MRISAIPFRFDIRESLRKLQRFGKKHVGGVTLNLPFFSISVNPTSREKEIARELTIRIQDRRILSANECCDNCIKEALASLQEIRHFLVDKQVAFSDAQDGPLYLLTEAMAVGIRQFLTYEQRLRGQGRKRAPGSFVRDERGFEIRQQYFDALELLRAHLSLCITQVAGIAGMDVPSEGLVRNYKGAWLVAAYETLELTEDDRTPDEGKLP